MTESRGNMLPNERQQFILDYLKKEVSIRGSKLSELLKVSEMTIRRDLDSLEKDGLIERTHGGAILQKERVNRKFIYQESAQENTDEKERIARASAALIQPNDTVYLGEGTTTSQMVRFVDPHLPFSIFTNNLGVLSYDREISADIIILGGKYNATTNSMGGPLTMEIIQRFQANKVFLGADGLSLAVGLTGADMDLSMNARMMIQNTRGQVIVMMDSSKFGKIGEAVIAKMKEIDLLVTGRKIPSDFKKELENLHVKVMEA